jgi:hypothetical protein
VNTASTTSKLGLMYPVDSDLFESSDFEQTMTILDGRPGVQTVGNYASLPTGLTDAQYGLLFMDGSNRSLWMWAGVANGGYIRANSMGILSIAYQGSDVATTTTVQASGPTLATLTFYNPGGRYLRFEVSPQALLNDGTAHAVGIDFWLDGALVAERGIQCGTPQGNAPSISFVYPPLTNNTNHTFRVSMRATNGSGGTATSKAGLQAMVYEL